MKLLRRRAAALSRPRAATGHSSVAPRSRSVFGGGSGVPLQAPQPRRQRFASGVGSIFASARSGLAFPAGGSGEHHAEASFAAAFPALPPPGVRVGLNRFGEAVSLLGRAAGAAGGVAAFHGGAAGVFHGGDAGGMHGLEVSSALCTLLPHAVPD